MKRTIWMKVISVVLLMAVAFLPVGVASAKEIGGDPSLTLVGDFVRGDLLISELGLPPKVIIPPRKSFPVPTPIPPPPIIRPVDPPKTI